MYLPTFDPISLHLLAEAPSFHCRAYQPFHAKGIDKNRYASATIKRKHKKLYKQRNKNPSRRAVLHR